MARPPLSPSTTDAIETLATAIRGARIRRGWTVRQLAERVGVSHATISALEAGRPGVAIGTIFEAATLVGVPLFSTSNAERAAYGALKRTELALLPATARPRPVDDDF
ncbi:MAG: helix-turn-helix transcriptional regulator [Microthrixaceae bacterium]